LWLLIKRRGRLIVRLVMRGWIETIGLYISLYISMLVLELIK